MLDYTFSSLFTVTGSMTLSAFLTCVLAALALGVVMALVYTFRSTYTRSFVVTLALLPAIVCVVIMMVGGNLGAGVAVAGTFSLIRFRSVPGTAKEICAIFLSMAVGLACGMGYPVFAAVFAVLMCMVILLLTVLNFGGHKNTQLRKVLRITVPEDLDYTGVFDDLLSKYTSQAELIAVKTTNLGSLNRLTYALVLKKAGTEKALIDELRCRNGNLEISISVQTQDEREL
ncbi:MAG: DUF4956 domain-containing protein [Oscillospiraceae bacterium]|nr:DUF4956 domain-containing protein [Oscillospiraceae bacterium]